MHMGYSENMLQLHQFDTQPTHFNKLAYTYHCTMEHLDENGCGENYPYTYYYLITTTYYYLIVDMKHDAIFTSMVTRKILSEVCSLSDLS